jgi:hypothetical protein
MNITDVYAKADDAPGKPVHNHEYPVAHKMSNDISR